MGVWVGASVVVGVAVGAFVAHWLSVLLETALGSVGAVGCPGKLLGHGSVLSSAQMSFSAFRQLAVLDDSCDLALATAAV